MGDYPNNAGTSFGHVQLIKGNDTSWMEKVNYNFRYLHTYRTHAYSNSDKTESVDANLPTGADYDRIIFLDTSAVTGTNNCTITLPTPTENLGREVIFIRPDNTQNIDITVTGSGSIVGVNQIPKLTGLRALYISNGVNWYGRIVDN